MGLIVSDYCEGHLAALQSNLGNSYAVAGLDVVSTHCYSGGKDNTTAEVTLKLGKALLSVQAVFPLSPGSIRRELLPSAMKFIESDELALRHMHESELWLLLAGTRSMDVNASYRLKLSKDRAILVLRVGSHEVVGTIRATDTLALARALSIGVGRIIQSEVDDIIKRLAAAFAAEAASKK